MKFVFTEQHVGKILAVVLALEVWQLQQLRELNLQVATFGQRLTDHIEQSHSATKAAPANAGARGGQYAPESPSNS